MPFFKLLGFPWSEWVKIYVNISNVILWSLAMNYVLTMTQSNFNQIQCQITHGNFKTKCCSEADWSGAPKFFVLLCPVQFMKQLTWQNWEVNTRHVELLNPGICNYHFQQRLQDSRNKQYQTVTFINCSFITFYYESYILLCTNNFLATLSVADLLTALKYFFCKDFLIFLIRYRSW